MPHMRIIGVPEEEDKKEDHKKILEIIVENFPKMGKEIATQVQETQFLTYLRLSIFLPAILIPACASSSPTFRMMYSAYRLNKQGDNIQL